MRIVLLFAAILMASPAWAGTLLVLENEGATGLKSGQIIDGTKEISVPAGARLVLIDERGIGATIKGPYKGAPGGGQRASGATLLERLASMLTSSSSSDVETVLGATRALGPNEPSPSAWAIDVSAGGAACVRTPADVVLWRPLPRPARIVNIGKVGEGTVSLRWPENAASMPWPEALALTDGATYQVSLGTSEKPKTVTFTFARMLLETDAMTLKWLSDSQCVSQTRMLLTEIGARRVVEGTAASTGVFD